MLLQIDKLGKVAVTIEKDYWNINKDYDKLTVVEVADKFATYISRIPVPAGTELNNRKYWIPFSSLKEEIVIHYNEWINLFGGLLTSQAEVLNNIQKIINDIYTHLPKGIIFEGDIDVYDVGESATIYLTCTTTGTKPASEIKLYKNNTLIETWHNVTGFEIDETVDNDTEFRVEAVIDGWKYYGSWNVAMVYPFYIGTGTDVEDIIANEDYKHKGSEGLNGIYQVSPNDSDNIFIVAPKWVAIPEATMGGVKIPFDSATEYIIDEIVYYVYKSSNQYQQGNYSIKIGSVEYDKDSLTAELLNKVTDMSDEFANYDDRISEVERISGNREESSVAPTHMGRVTLKPNVKYPITKGWGIYSYTFDYDGDYTVDVLIYFENDKFYLPYRNVRHPKVINVISQTSYGEQKLDVGDADVNDIATALNITEESQYLFYDDDDFVVTMPDDSKLLIADVIRNNWPLHDYTDFLDVKNLLTQSMINEPNTIYVIQYDFTLDGKEITIPEGCVLKFEGGSLSNGSLILNDNTTLLNGILNHTTINSSSAKNINIKDCIFDGEFQNSYSLLNLENVEDIKISNISVRNFRCTYTEGMTTEFHCISCISCNNIVIDWASIYNIYPEGPLFRLCENITIRNMSIDEPEAKIWTCLHFWYCNNVEVYNSSFKHLGASGSTINSCSDNIVFDDCKIIGGHGLDLGNEGDRTFVANNIKIYNCYFKGNKVPIYGSGDVELLIKKVDIINCFFEIPTTTTGIFGLYDAENVTFENCILNISNRIVYTEATKILGTLSFKQCTIIANGNSSIRLLSTLNKSSYPVECNYSCIQFENNNITVLGNSLTVCGLPANNVCEIAINNNIFTTDGEVTLCYQDGDLIKYINNTFVNKADSFKTIAVKDKAAFIYNYFENLALLIDKKSYCSIVGNYFKNSLLSEQVDVITISRNLYNTIVIKNVGSRYARLSINDVVISGISYISDNDIEINSEVDKETWLKISSKNPNTQLNLNVFNDLSSAPPTSDLYTGQPAFLATPYLPIWRANNRYIDALGFSPLRRRGRTQDIPTPIKDTDTGFVYYDYENKEFVYLKEADENNDFANPVWCKLDGAKIGVLRIGTSTQRPNGLDVYEGFRFYDTTIQKTVVYTGQATSWLTEEGFSPVADRGTFANRPTNQLTATDEGFPYYCTDTHKVIYFSFGDGTTSNPKTWYYADGTEVTA